ncbi:MAG: hypothetical protein K2L69_07045, partial [Muribaculaceae bacterium]|nr:hypothetical protein [Muribaculaceae bacterium]
VQGERIPVLFMIYITNINKQILNSKRNSKKELITRTDYINKYLNKKSGDTLHNASPDSKSDSP